MTDTERAPMALHLPVETVSELPERADVVVVGGGIAGVSVLYHLAARGIDALLLESDRVGGGATSAAVGVLSPPMRQPFHLTVRHRGEGGARALWALAGRSVAALGDTLEAMDVAVEAELDREGGFRLAQPHTLEQVERSYRALEKAELRVEWLDAEAVRARVGGRGFVGGYRLEGGGALNPAATARLLARGAVSLGARVAESSPVLAVERRDGGLVCRTEAGEVRCSMVVYATHTRSRRFSSLVGDEVVPVRGQALAAEVVSGTVPAGAYSTFWKLNVWRRSGPGRVHLGGWRHEAWDRSYQKKRPVVDTKLQESLIDWFRAAFPSVDLRVTRRWSGIFGWTADYLPLVGPLPGTPDELVVAGFSGADLPFAFECGRIVADIIGDRDPGPDAELFAPERFVR